MIQGNKGTGIQPSGTIREQNPLLHPVLPTPPPGVEGEDACSQPRPLPPAHPAQPYLLEFRWELAKLCPAISGGGW